MQGTRSGRLTASTMSSQHAHNIPTYSGTSTWHTFIVQFETSARIFKWSDDDKLLYLCFSLKDAAAEFAYSELSEAERDSYEKLKDALANRFKDHRTPAFFQNVLDKRTYLKSETTAEYATDLKRLVTKSFPMADQATRDAIGFKQFLRGLPDQSMAIQVGTMAVPPTVDKARAALDTILNLRDNVCLPTQQVASIATDHLAREISGLREDLREFMASQRGAVTQPVREGRDNRMAEPRCFGCDRIGHISRNCPNQETIRTKSSSLKLNHISSKSNVHNLRPNFVFVPVKVCGTRTDFLMDTGAAVTILSKRAFNRMQQRPKLKTHLVPLHLQSASGTSIKLHGVCDLDLLIGEKVYPWTVHIADITDDGYLGFDFLCHYDFSFSIKRGLNLHRDKVPVITKCVNSVTQQDQSYSLVENGDLNEEEDIIPLSTTSNQLPAAAVVKINMVTTRRKTYPPVNPPKPSPGGATTSDTGRANCPVDTPLVPSQPIQLPCPESTSNRNDRNADREPVVVLCADNSDYKFFEGLDISKEDLRRLQQEDNDLSHVFKWIKDKTKPKREEISGESPAVRNLWLNLDLLIVVDGVLCKRWFHPGRKDEILKIMLPRSLVSTVLKKMHSSVYAGHLGINKVLDNVRTYYSWYRMKRDVQTFITNCATCQHIKRPQANSSARKHLKTAAQRQKRDHDTRAVQHSFNVGDVVLYLDLTKQVGRNPKLNPNKWRGPFVVSRKFSDVLFEIRGEGKTKARIIHHDRLKPYYDNNPPDWILRLQTICLRDNLMGATPELPRVLQEA